MLSLGFYFLRGTLKIDADSVLLQSTAHGKSIQPFIGYAENMNVLKSWVILFSQIAKYIFFRTFCGNPAAFNIPQNETEYDDDYTLYYGYFNFDNIFMSLFTSLSFLSITGWSNVNDIVIFFFINIS